MTKPANFHVLMAGGERPWVLQLEPCTKADCERAIRWQHAGGNDEPMYIVRWDADAKTFVDESGRKFSAHIGARTIESWNGFLSSLPGMERRYALAEARKHGAIGTPEKRVFDCAIATTGSHSGTVDALICAINDQGWEVFKVLEHSAKRDCLG